MRQRGILFAIMAILFATPGYAQQPCANSGGTVTGVVLDDSTRTPIAGVWVVSLFTNCRTVTDAQGRFRLQGARPGNDRIDIGRPGYRQFSPVGVAIEAGKTTEVTLRLRRGGPVDDCRVNAACARLLSEDRTSLADPEDQFRLMAHAVVIALIWDTVANGEWYACVSDPKPAVLEELRNRYTRVATEAECMMKEGPNRPRERLHHIATGNLAFRIRLDTVTETGPTTRRAFLSYMHAGLWGAGYECDFERVRYAWRPVLCTMVVQA